MSDQTNNSHARSRYPSRVTLPECPDPKPSILDFLDKRFPRLGREGLRQRIRQGELTESNGEPINLETAYRVGLVLLYYREVDNEIKIPFKETIIFQNDHILVACKPHFLPVTPGGKYVNECLLYRLRATTGNDDLVPLHRLDRETAGLVIFSTRIKTRGLFGELFENRLIKKEYEAIGSLPSDSSQREWLIESRIDRSSHQMVMANVEGEINAVTKVRLIETKDELGRFALKPLTGKTHQLRLHLTNIGSQIVNDRIYPTLQADSPPDFEHPLKLLAKRLAFEDPLEGKKLSFESTRTLEFE